MLIALVVSCMVLARIPWWVIGLGLASVAHPFAIFAALLAWAVAARAATSRRIRVTPGEEAEYFGALAAELRSGASLRSALVDACGRTPRLPLDGLRRLAMVGAPVLDVAELVTQAFPENGRLAGPVLRLSASTGGNSAALFDLLAERARGRAEMRRELRSATAQARLSAAVVGGAPAALAAALLLSGRGDVLLRHGSAGIGILVVGAGLEVVGLVVVMAMSRSAA